MPITKNKFTTFLNEIHLDLKKKIQILFGGNIWSMDICAHIKLKSSWFLPVIVAIKVVDI